MASHLLGLPLEVREHIFDFVASSTTLVLKNSDAKFDHIDLLMTCRQIAREAFPRFHQWARVDFDHTTLAGLINTEASLINMFGKNPNVVPVIEPQRRSTVILASFRGPDTLVEGILLSANDPATLAGMFWGACEKQRRKSAQIILAKLDTLAELKSANCDSKPYHEMDLVRSLLDVDTNLSDDKDDLGIRSQRNFTEATSFTNHLDQDELCVAMLYQEDAANIALKYGHFKILKILIKFEAARRRARDVESDWLKSHRAEALTKVIKAGHGLGVEYLLCQGVHVSSDHLTHALSIQEDSKNTKLFIITSLMQAGAVVKPYYKSKKIIVEDVTS